MAEHLSAGRATRRAVRGVTAALAAALAVGATLAACGDRADGPDRPDPAPGVLHGPGAHWLDFVEPGIVRFAARATVAVDVSGDGSADATLELTGETVVYRSASYPRPGSGAHRDHLDLEIVSMHLAGSGVDLVAGDGIANLRADGPLFSIGSSDERPDAPALASDRFAVAFTGTIGGRAVRGEAPLLVHAEIDRLPPLGNPFTLAAGPLRLLDDAGDATGIAIVGLRFVPTTLLDESSGARSPALER